MKHLDDSNKEAQEEAEMDAEIELELAQGTLCCMGAPGCVGGGVEKGLAAPGAGPGGTAGGRERGGARGEKGDGLKKMRHTAVTAHQGPYNSHGSNRTLYSPAQVSLCICVCARSVCVGGFSCLFVDSGKDLFCFNLCLNICVSGTVFGLN